MGDTRFQSLSAARSLPQRARHALYFCYTSHKLFLNKLTILRSHEKPVIFSCSEKKKKNQNSCLRDVQFNTMKQTRELEIETGRQEVQDSVG